MSTLRVKTSQSCEIHYITGLELSFALYSPSYHTLHQLHSTPWSYLSYLLSISGHTSTMARKSAQTESRNTRSAGIRASDFSQRNGTSLLLISPSIIADFCEAETPTTATASPAPVIKRRLSTRVSSRAQHSGMYTSSAVCGAPQLIPPKVPYQLLPQ